MDEQRLSADDRTDTPRLSRRSFLVSMCAAGAVFGFPAPVSRR